jgi:hypothetical protein
MSTGAFPQLSGQQQQPSNVLTGSSASAPAIAAAYAATLVGQQSSRSIWTDQQFQVENYIIKINLLFRDKTI